MYKFNKSFNPITCGPCNIQLKINLLRYIKLKEALVIILNCRVWCKKRLGLPIKVFLQMKKKIVQYFVKVSFKNWICFFSGRSRCNQFGDQSIFETFVNDLNLIKKAFLFMVAPRLHVKLDCNKSALYSRMSFIDKYI